MACLGMKVQAWALALRAALTISGVTLEQNNKLINNNNKK